MHGDRLIPVSLADCSRRCAACDLSSRSGWLSRARPWAQGEGARPVQTIREEKERVCACRCPVVFVPLTLDQDEDRTRATILDWFDRSAWRCAPVEDFGPPDRQPVAARARDACGAGGAGGPD